MTPNPTSAKQQVALMKAVLAKGERGFPAEIADLTWTTDATKGLISGVLVTATEPREVYQFELRLEGDEVLRTWWRSDK